MILVFPLIKSVGHQEYIGQYIHPSLSENFNSKFLYILNSMQIENPVIIKTHLVINEIEFLLINS